MALNIFSDPYLLCCTQTWELNNYILNNKRLQQFSNLCNTYFVHLGEIQQQNILFREPTASRFFCYANILKIIIYETF